MCLSVNEREATCQPRPSASRSMHTTPWMVPTNTCLEGEGERKIVGPPCDRVIAMVVSFVHSPPTMHHCNGPTLKDLGTPGPHMYPTAAPESPATPDSPASSALLAAACRPTQAAPCNNTA